MPLELYRRGELWWARGRIEYQGRPITGYYRCSTGSASEAGARQWLRDEEAARIRDHLVGPAHSGPAPLTFAQAVALYPANAKTAAYLIPLVAEIGNRPLAELTPVELRGLGPKLYPAACTDTWTRQVLSPARAVINHAHDLGRAAPIRIKGYTPAERAAQDKARGQPSRVKKTPGSWEWLLKFRQHAPARHAALALFMFVTGARISQAVAMHPGLHLRLQEGLACIPGAKGMPDRWVQIPPELVADLANLPPLVPRGYPRTPENLRVFGFADRSSPRKGWDAACKAAGIERIPFHSAGRHGFGQELNVRNPVDEKAAGEFGGWADTNLMRRTYTHPEATAEKVHAALRTGLRAAERQTRLKLHPKPKRQRN